MRKFYDMPALLTSADRGGRIGAAMRMKRPICAFLILTFISTFAVAQTTPVQPQQEEETVESLRLQLREAQYNAARRNPEHAVFWSILPGGGQVYNGEYIKAALAYGAILLSALAGWGNTGYAWLPLVVWTYTSYDAHQTAVDYNQELKKKYGLSSIRLE